jgi:mannose-6-phosphate isomerase-like protein (cupin superfamily)
MAVPEAPLRPTRFGLVPDGEGWFVLNATETRWRDYGPLGVGADFQGKRPFPQLGVKINVLGPGEPLGMYHRENHQEGFLVLSGECVLIVEGQERTLRAWDVVHCPSGTAHAIVGAGDGPSVVLAVGARGGRKGLVYLRDAAALDPGAGVTHETSLAAEAYPPFPRPTRCAYRPGWLPPL